MSEQTPVANTGRHPVNVAHLVMGLAFIGLAVTWSLIANDIVDDDSIRWLLPIPWVVAGLAGLFVLARGGARRHGGQVTGWVEPNPAATPEPGATAEPGSTPSED
ncbi:hypothetical protein [Nocardioides sp.]|uniref:hypothetical protein n=1 Tax=Nocardioides sp. TaxID=35761 RepID=UPI003562A01E